MRTIQALLVMLCASLFAVASASAGSFSVAGSLPGAPEDSGGYTLAKSNGITVTICGPWNNWCSPGKGGNQKCGKWNNWCGQANKGEKCGKWNNWCGQASSKGKPDCGKWNNWCKDPQSGADTRGKKDDKKKKDATETAASAGAKKCTSMGLVPAGDAASVAGLCNCMPPLHAVFNAENGLVRSPGQCGL